LLTNSSPPPARVIVGSWQERQLPYLMAVPAARGSVGIFSAPGFNPKWGRPRAISRFPLSVARTLNVTVGSGMAQTALPLGSRLTETDGPGSAKSGALRTRLSRGHPGTEYHAAMVGPEALIYATAKHAPHRRGGAPLATSVLVPMSTPSCSPGAMPARPRKREAIHQCM
jgi:hypothetical protein